MPYTPPLGTQCDFYTTTAEFPRQHNGLSCHLGGAYAAPLGNNIQSQFSATPTDWVPPANNAVNFVAIIGPAYPVGFGSVEIPITVVGHGTHTPSHFDGTGAATIPLTVTGTGKHGVRGAGAAEIPFAVSATGRVVRYELLGEVRLQGVLVDRTVRAYRRDTGALVGEAVTVAGKFKMQVGFEAREHYVIPLNLDSLADDFAPPCANRILSVLAQDQP